MLSDLKINDPIKFGILLQKQLSDNFFTVSSISKYSFKNVSNYSFTIKNENDTYSLSFITDKEQLAISYHLSDEEVQKAFNLQKLALVFTGKTDFEVNTLQHNIDKLKNWLEPCYTKNFDYVLGNYYPDIESHKSDKFYYYTISANNSSIDIEVFDNEKVNFYVTIYIPISSLKICNG